MFQPLEPRRLFATITGNLWNDTDGSTLRNADESAVKSTIVFIDANLNGQLDAGERTSITNKSGNYDFKDLAAGSYVLGVIPPSGDGLTTPLSTGAARSGFDILLAHDDTFTPAIERAFAEAGRRIESIVTGDLPDVSGIDDLRISVSIDRIDGSGGTLAQGGPTRVRAGSGLPYAGEISFDSADVSNLISEGHFVDTIEHEMLHVLGFGTIWSDLGLINGEGTRQPSFTGPAATKAYDALFRSKATSVPLESDGGDGTADGHWPESTFTRELMTGFDEGRNVSEPLSRITVASLADIGYTVNLNAADTWDPIHDTDIPATAQNLGTRPFEWNVTVSKIQTVNNVDFGLRAARPPSVDAFGAGSAVLGRRMSLSAFVSDPDNNALFVDYYHESNGQAGLQLGTGGDAYLGQSNDRSGHFPLTPGTAGMAAGLNTFYAVVTDATGRTGSKSTQAVLTAPPPPTRPNPVVVTRTSRSTALLQWKDRSDNEIGFRIQLLTDDGTIVQSFNVPADTVATDLAGLTRGVFYTARIRAYGYGGASAYTRTDRFRV